MHALHMHKFMYFTCIHTCKQYACMHALHMHKYMYFTCIHTCMHYTCINTSTTNANIRACTTNAYTHELHIITSGYTKPHVKISLSQSDSMMWRSFALILIAEPTKLSRSMESFRPRDLHYCSDYHIFIIIDMATVRVHWCGQKTAE